MPLMSPVSQSGGRFTGPPSPPPDTPSLTAYRPVAGGEMEGTEGAGPAQAGAVPRLFFQADQALDQIASAVPGASATIDRIKTELKDLLVQSLSGKASPEEKDAEAVP